MGKDFFDRFVVKLDQLKDKGFGRPTQEILNERLETAIRNGWAERAEKALADGADVDALFPVRVAEGDKLSGHTPLAAAIRLNNAVMVDLLLLFKADTEARSQNVGVPTALGTAVMRENLPMVTKLLAAGAYAEADIKDLVPVGASSIMKQFVRMPLVDYAWRNHMPEIAKTLEKALQKPVPVQGHHQAFMAADVGTAFRKNFRKGTGVVVSRPKTARFTKNLSR